MKKTAFIILVLAFCIYLAGCGKKEPSPEDLMQQEPMSIEELSIMGTETEAPAAQPTVISLESLPPAGPYKPTVSQIQTALKNAGYYTANIDAKSGPKTKQAIREFQKANGLKADGIVGPRTWDLLGKYLSEKELQRK